MDAASSAVPLPLALLAAAVIGALQVTGYILVGRGVRALVEDDAPFVTVAAPVLAFALAAATAAALPPPPATAAAMATLALGAAAAVGARLVRRHAAWRLVLADPSVAVRLEARAAARSRYVLAAGLAVLVVAGGLGGGLATPVPGWAALVAVLALAPLPAAAVAAIAAVADTAVAGIAPLRLPADVPGLALAIAAALAVPRLVPTADVEPRP